MKTRLLLGVAAAAIGFSTASHAIFLDLTTATFDELSGSSTFSTTVGGLSVDLTSVNGNIDTTEDDLDVGSAPFCGGTDPDAPGTNFACANDGIGVFLQGGLGEIDEINAVDEQTLTLELGEEVEITALYLLDFFALAEDVEDSASVSFDDGEMVMTFGPTVGVGDETPNTGFTVISVDDVRASQLTFSAQGLEGAETADYAVAGIEYNLINDNGDTMIPVPAALPLLLTAMIGLGVLGRRRRDEA